MDVDLLVESCDPPHLRNGMGEWKTEGARARLETYALKLQDLGMNDINIQIMFDDLYWDAWDEYLANSTFERRKLLYRK